MRITACPPAAPEPGNDDACPQCRRRAVGYWIKLTTAGITLITSLVALTQAVSAYMLN